MAFHAGLLRKLAELGTLENVSKISSVSGGSLLVGLIYQYNNMTWPSSQQFLNIVYPSIKDALCQQSMQWGALRQLWPLKNLRFILSRANLLAIALTKEWGITQFIDELPEYPSWSVNGTTAENGRRFRFKRDSIGDYKLGYAKINKYPLANALAVSAAFPGGFGPLAINTKNFIWLKKDWGDDKNTETVVMPPFKYIHLYDGGVYDNLGIEPFFDSGRGVSKVDDHFILVSDAGLPLSTGFSSGSLNPFRLKRVADIMSDQSHSLRIRSFINYIEKNSCKGYFVYIDDNSLKETKFSNVSRFPTTLKKLTESQFNHISECGYILCEKMVCGDK